MSARSLLVLEAESQGAGVWLVKTDALAPEGAFVYLEFRSDPETFVGTSGLKVVSHGSVWHVPAEVEEVLPDGRLRCRVMRR